MTTPILDHVGLAVADFERAKAFYVALLKTLDIDLLADFSVGRQQVAGFGRGRPSFWISAGRPKGGSVHVAFAAASRAEVNAFHAVGLSLGGRDNGAPGIRAHYHPHYYGAFVLDADGHNLEAVCHAPQ